MQGRYTVPHPASAPQACVVCERPLDRPSPGLRRPGATDSPPTLHPLCPDPHCRGIFDTTWANSDVEFRHQLRWRAQSRRDSESRARRLRERRVGEAREAEAVFVAIGEREDLGPGPTIRLVVPSGRGRERPLSQRRRRAYIANLDLMIAAATGAIEPFTEGARHPGTPVQPPGEEAAAELPSLAGRLCGVCGGGCCPAGGTHAFLGDVTIRRVLADNPDLDVVRLREMYLERLPERSISGSCVNQTRDGCALPRALRSDVCNTWTCLPFAKLLEALAADPPVRKAIVLRRRQNHWNQNDAPDHDLVGAEVITEAKTTRLRLPKSDD